MYNSYNQSHSVAVKDFFYKTYAWMATALTVTATTAYMVFNSPSLSSFLWSYEAKIGLFIAQIALVFFLQMKLYSMKFSVAAVMLMVYAVMVGLSISTIFLYFRMDSICTVFGTAAMMFGTMALYGYATDRDLSKLTNIFLMGLVGLFLAGIFNFWFDSSLITKITSYIGVLLFAGLTAYDMQRIKYLAQSVVSDSETANKATLFAALHLYLDFVNMFLYLLRLMGRKK